MDSAYNIILRKDVFATPCVVVESAYGGKVVWLGSVRGYLPLPNCLNASTMTIRTMSPAVEVAAVWSSLCTDAMNAIPARTSITAMSRMVLNAWLLKRLVASSFHHLMINILELCLFVNISFHRNIESVTYFN